MVELAWVFFSEVVGTSAALWLFFDELLRVNLLLGFAAAFSGVLGSGGSLPLQTG